MAHSPPPMHGPDAKRPKGILKNSNSYQRSPPHKPVTVLDPLEAPSENIPPSTTIASVSPLEAAPDHPLQQQLAERDIVLQNTLKNAGRRRSSSNQSRGATGSRRPSYHDTAADAAALNGEASPRLKWDEANLYLTEQERTPKMKIDEPKTPFAKGYDPAEDEAELRMLDADVIQVDELDPKPSLACACPSSPTSSAAADSSHRPACRRHVTPDTHIPALDLGEPEAQAPPPALAVSARLTRRESHSPKQVVVCEDDVVGHAPGAAGHEPETPEEEEKHKKFEELRKKHYEMKNVANLLGHPEFLEEEDDDGDVLMDCHDDDDDEGDVAPNGLPPRMPGSFVNGEK